MAKYGNKQVFYDGKLFDSKKELARYKELSMLERAGEISDLKMQVPFELIPPAFETYERYGNSGKRLKDGRKCIERGVTYKADFVYKDRHGETVVEDTKGVRTKEYILKRKLMLNIYGIRIREL